MAVPDLSEHPDRVTLADDYARTVQVFALLADIRFKLLAFVPSIVGVTVALVSREHDRRVIVAVSAVGFVATVGILLYELRNSELYNAAAHRARILERKLELIVSVPTRERRWQENGGWKRELWPEQGGVFSERPYVPKTGERGFRLFRVLKVKHDRALALVYGAAIGAWTYLVIHAVIRLSHGSGSTAFGVAGATGVVVAVLIVREVNLHDESSQMRPWEPPSDATGDDASRV
jgi:hypothetical protein